MMEFTLESAFWVFNMVSNYAYTRYSVIHPEIREKQTAMEWNFLQETKELDAKAAELAKTDPDGAVAMLTDYSVKAGNETHDEWLAFYQYLFTKYMDGNIKEDRPVPEGYKYVTPKLKQPGYNEDYYRRVAEETGDKLKVTGSSH
jgi:dipeptidase